MVYTVTIVLNEGKYCPLRPFPGTEGVSLALPSRCKFMFKILDGIREIGHGSFTWILHSPAMLLKKGRGGAL